MSLEITKRYSDLPAAHRQHKHDGHCRHLHGHGWSFDITFEASSLDDNGFVVDFGKLKRLKEKLETCFDHTFLVNQDDPHLDVFLNLQNLDLCRVVVVPNGSAEALAQLVFDLATAQMLEEHGGRVWIKRVVCWEDAKNSATVSK